MSCNNNSVNSLMGFSVNQPALGAPLQFFPAMGSKQLDEMIDTYVPGDASIQEKRIAVSMEFFQHTMTTGEMFKFFMVYPTLPSASTSPTMESEYHSSFTSSPAMSDSQWTSAYSTSSRMVSPSSSKRAAATNDFSNMPGMKIMTKDGRDVTNSASRGCKTKEQRDHAHLMRMLKACESCRRKKTKCDPSHKRPAAGTSSAKITKKASKTTRAAPAAAAPPIAAKEAPISTEFDSIFTASLPSLDFSAESLNVATDGFSMEWDQFIQYDEEPTEQIPYDYDFFLDPAGYFSPATTTSFSSSSTSPSQVPITPIDRDVNIIDTTTDGHDHKPILPYLNPGGLEAGSNYVDFNLYSPQSSFDEELDLMREVAASPIQSQRLDWVRLRATDIREEGTSSSSVGCLDADCSYRQNVISDAVGDGIFHGIPQHMDSWSQSVVAIDATDHGGVFAFQQGGTSSNPQTLSSQAPTRRVSSAVLVTDEVLETATSDGLYGREAIYEQEPSRPLSGRDRDRGRLRASLEVNASEHGADHQQDDLTVSLGRESLRPRKAQSTHDINGLNSPSRTLSWAGTAVTASSLPTQRPVEMLVVRDIAPSIAGLRLIVMKDYRQDVRYEQTIDFSTTRAPQLKESPVPVAALQQKKSSTEPSSSCTTIMSEQRNRPTTHGGVLHAAVTLRESPAVLWDSQPGSQITTGQSPARFGQVTAMEMYALPPMSVIAGLGFFSVLLSFRSPRAEIGARNNGLIQPVQSAASGNTIATYATMALLLLCIAQHAISYPGSYLLMSWLSILAGTKYRQLKQSARPRDPEVFNTFPSHTLPTPSHTQIDLVDGLKYICAKIMRTVQCNLRSWLLPSASPQKLFTDGASQRLSTQGLQKAMAIKRWTAIPLV
ncbi:hypothetical protein F5Y08DRAFT_331909 [Xylaria arbuscula]|nr:hypothetical protein F5Y08DRAFT_331909 [Xylaria arbuscula]